MSTDALLAEVGRTHLFGWLDYPRNTGRDGTPKHDECRKCTILREDNELRNRIWQLRAATRMNDAPS